MTTEFKNIVINKPDENSNTNSTGEVITISTWNVWDCINKKWSDKPPVQLRNILLAGMHPTPQERFCIGEIPIEIDDPFRGGKITPDPSVLNPFTPPKSEKYYLDLASGSRTHGRFTFAKTTIGRWYYNEDWKRIIYGSIVHTGCKRLRYTTLNIIVTDDTLVDDEGNLRDDPTNNKHWHTGDSHAKASKKFMEFLGAPLEYLTGEITDNNYSHNTPLQFRIAVRSTTQEMGKYGDGWVGKGTVAYNPDLDNSEYDLAIPISCMKGNKLSLGNYQNIRCLLGMVFEAEDDRVAKLGWMFWQWFTTNTINRDGIYKKLADKMGTVADAYNSIEKCAELMRITQFDIYEKLALGDSINDEAEYENLMTRIIKADITGSLFRHPWIVLRIKQRLQKMWLNFAKSLGVRFYSLMTQPDDTLAHYHTVNEDGSIEGRKVFCAPGFEEGEYIVYSNPMRHWGDIQIWENKHEGFYVNATWGIMAVPTKLALSLGRDFDGDWVQLISVKKLPFIANTIRHFKKPPVVEKFPKVALTGHIQKIAVNSMNNYVGIVANTLGKARALKIENYVLEIPAGGMQKEPKLMSIIDFLSQELQIAVDSIKSAYPNNKKGIDYVQKFVDTEGGTGVLWMAGLKESNTYLNNPCPLDPTITDTMSCNIEWINQWWKGAVLPEDISPRAFKDTLFSDETVNQFQLSVALTIRTQYRSSMAEFIQIKQETGDDQIYHLVLQYRSLGDRIRDNDKSLSFLTNTDYSFRSWVTAFWRVSHEAETGGAGLVFTMFGDEIVKEVMVRQIPPSATLTVWGVNHGGWSYKWELIRPFTWCGQEVEIKVVEKLWQGKDKSKPAKPILAYEMEYNGQVKFLGFASTHEYKYITLGEKRTMCVYERVPSTLSLARQREQGVWSGGKFYPAVPKLDYVHLIDPNLSEEQVNLITTYKRADGIKVNQLFKENALAKINEIEALESNKYDDYSDQFNQIPIKEGE